MDAFDEDTVAGFLSEEEHFQATSLVPTMLKRLFNIKAFKTHRNFKAVLLGGGPSDTQLLKGAIEKGIPVVASFGMMETCAQIAANPLLKPSGTYIPVKSARTYISP
ncbi:MAG: hypothetical protein U5K69_25510 [Balneolaceae bacterium]|nr:hypothetical protein [Balneolaceae bacterium]